MEDGGWRMEDGGWRMEDGGWRMEGAFSKVGTPNARSSRFCPMFEGFVGKSSKIGLLKVAEVRARSSESAQSSGAAADGGTQWRRLRTGWEVHPTKSITN